MFHLIHKKGHFTDNSETVSLGDDGLKEADAVRNKEEELWI